MPRRRPSGRTEHSGLTAAFAARCRSYGNDYRSRPLLGGLSATAVPAVLAAAIGRTIHQATPIAAGSVHRNIATVPTATAYGNCGAHVLDMIAAARH